MEEKVEVSRIEEIVFAYQAAQALDLEEAARELEVAAQRRLLAGAKKRGAAEREAEREPRGLQQNEPPLRRQGRLANSRQRFCYPCAALTPTCYSPCPLLVE